MAKYDKQKISMDLAGLDEEAKKRIRDAVEKAGLSIEEGGGGGGVRPADVGEIETSLEISTAGLDEKRVQELRDKVFSSENHSKILDTILRGALGEYGGAASTPFVQWLWCQWLKYASFTNELAKGIEPPREIFKKRYKIVPGRIK